MTKDAAFRKKIALIEKTLRELGVKMSVHGCGCCGSPDVYFKYGEVEIDESNFCFDTEIKRGLA